jgi:peptidoglycan/LPS O-acetylase OafA/YrhL
MAINTNPNSAGGPPEVLDALTSLRFFAAFLVLCFHYHLEAFKGEALPPLISLGYTGVTFFFVLSGFILSHRYARTTFDREESFRFTVARIARIYPVFLLSLVLAIPEALNHFLYSAGLVYAIRAVGFILTPLGLHAWLPGAACFINCPSWSISTEFFFYATFPFLMPFVFRRPLAWLLGTIIAAIALWALLLPLADIVKTGKFFRPSPSKTPELLFGQFIVAFPILRLPEFVLGITCYALWRRYRQIPNAIYWLLFVLAGSIILATSDGIPSIIMQNGLTVVVWVPLILAAASSQRGPLHLPLMIFLGQISYSLYLLHVPVLDTLRMFQKLVLNQKLSDTPWTSVLTATPLALLAAVLAYRYVEEPCRKAIRNAVLGRKPAAA